MVALYALYAVLIGTAIVILPLRVRARRRTLKEIDGLRHAFRQSVGELVLKVQPEAAMKLVDQILGLAYENGQPMITVLAEDQSLPTCPYPPENPHYKYDRDAYLRAQQDMRKAGWRKVV